jgi:uncharacterized membrane protein
MSSITANASETTVPAGNEVGAAVLGFAFGGFFDGILLHQVLQWHHLLSLVKGGSVRTFGFKYWLTASSTSQFTSSR